MKDEISQYQPSEVSAPGETLDDLLRERGLAQRKVAPLLGISAKHLNEVVKGKAPITPQLAIGLENVLGAPAAFWNNREKRYREYLARLEADGELRRQLGWLKKIPVRGMINAGWLEAAAGKVEQLRATLKFFGVADIPSLEQYLAGQETFFRRAKKFESDPGALAAWLRQGELAGLAVETQPFERARFEAALKQALALTGEPLPDLLPELTRRCAAAGVAVVLVPEIKGTRVCGATRWLRPDRALVQLSLRYRYNDNFWFSFYHEAGHILLHGKKELFLETENRAGDKEAEADRFAARMLIPPALFNAFLRQEDFTRAAVERFARRAGIAPGIVAGRLHHERRVNWSELNYLRLRLEPDAPPDRKRQAS